MSDKHWSDSRYKLETGKTMGKVYQLIVENIGDDASGPMGYTSPTYVTTKLFYTLEDAQRWATSKYGAKLEARWYEDDAVNEWYMDSLGQYGYYITLNEVS